MLAKMWNALKAQKPSEPLRDEKEIQKKYTHLRRQMMVSMLIGYAAFYLVRKNFSMAMPSFLGELNYTKTDLGIILSLFSILYGVGKFLNGMLADRSNPRFFMALGLFAAAIMNLFFGLSSGLWTLGIFWLLNAWFQSMGWPPCARMLTHWYAPKELGTMWGIWNSSHQVGGAAILILAGYLIPNYGWRSAFFIPAIIAILAALYLVATLRDTPQSQGLPSIEEYKGEVLHHVEEKEENLREILKNHILTNKMLWIVCLANMFVYIVRIGVLDWAPTFLVEAKNSSLEGAGWKVASFEISGIVGALAAGILSDKVFKGRRGPANVFFMIAVTICLILFWQVPPGYAWLDAFALFLVGFFIYGPQMLVGVAAADYASKHAAATATGLTGTFGYIGSAICGVGTGLIVDRWGWDGGFAFFITCAVLGTLLFALTWSKRSATLEALHNHQSSSLKETLTNQASGTLSSSATNQ